MHTEYSGGLQNWDVIFSDDNLIYFANNAGVLEFNGEQWFKFEFENTGHPRSFQKADDGTIYIGGQNEFGKLAFDELGHPFIEKLSQDLDTLDFRDVWHIHCIEEKTYLVALKHVFIMDSTGIEVVPSPNDLNIKQSYVYNNQIVVTLRDHESRTNFILRGNKFFKIQESDGVHLVGHFFNHSDEQIFVQVDGQCFKMLQNGNNYKLKELDFKFQPLEGIEDFTIRHISARNGVVIASVFGQGAVLYDYFGNFIRKIGEEEGLTNSIVHKSDLDQYNNLWLCTDNGISFVETSSMITKYSKDMGVLGTTEDLAFHGDTVILGTHSDVFLSEEDNVALSFSGTNIFGMEIWQIKNFTFPDGYKTKLVIANDGVYSLSDKLEKKLLAKYVYAWDLYQSKTDPNRIFVGLDGSGIGSLYYNSGEFEYEGNYGNTSGDVRSIVEKDGQVYYAVKNLGIVKLDTTKNQEENVLTGLKQHASEKEYEAFTIEEFGNQTFVGTVHGLYEMQGDQLSESKVEDCKFCEEDLLIHRLINDNFGKLWIVMFHQSGSDDEWAEMGYLQEKDGELKWNSAPFNQIKEDVIYTIKRADDGIYWFGGADAVYTYNENVESDYAQDFQVFISGIFLNEEIEYLYHAKYATLEENTFSYDQNSIRFQFGANAYLGGIENEYSYYLEGEEDSWSKWKTTPYADYQRLREGDYILHLKARNFYGYESEETAFAFTVLPPWYRTWWSYLIYFGLFALLVYILIRLSIRRVKAQNEKLEQIVEERTAEIAKQNTKLEIQKAEIQEKTNDILDSIKYAERIQTAILPTDETLNNIFDGEHFVLYKPKDIVSGDFYWADRFGDEAIFAAVDCTGHGVPGAFVSIVGFNGLNRTVNEFDLRKPGKILDKLTDLVVGTFAKSESQIKDGMDIAICNIDYSTNVLTYAGANNPFVLIRNGVLTEIKANKQPIGEFHHRVPFTDHEVQLEKGDCVYVFSDGFADQFGGDKGKKFKNKALKELLIEISTFDMNTQRKNLNEAFENWKGDFEQLDDVCLFGVKIQ